jgi:hypothetical protein
MEIINNKKNHETTTNDVSYPSARYFQVYFDTLHEELNENKRMMESLQMQMSDLLTFMVKKKQRKANGKITLSEPSKHNGTSFTHDEK